MLFYQKKFVGGFSFLDLLIGMILRIQQAVGRCGRSEARTEIIRVVHYDIRGNMLDISHYSTKGDGETEELKNGVMTPYKSGVVDGSTKFNPNLRFFPVWNDSYHTRMNHSRVNH